MINRRVRVPHYISPRSVHRWNWDPHPLSVERGNVAQKESKLSRAIMDRLRLEGYFCFKIHGSEHMMAGLPDIIVCADGFFIGLETKRPETRDDVSPIQNLRHQQIRQAAGFVAIVCSVNEALEVVSKYLAS